MSRSNPSINATNPSTRWFEWDGESGVVRHYDKEAKENVIHKLPFSFIVLDELASVRGWHEKSKSGIYSNEVRDTRAKPFLVKTFKGETLAEGVYAQIKDRLHSLGGKFTTNIYIAFKDGNGLKIGALQLKGAALSSWMDFRKGKTKEILSQAVSIVGTEHGKKGKIEFEKPVFEIKELSEASNDAAVALDKELQEYLTAYLSRTSTAQAAHTAATTDEEPNEADGVDPIDDTPSDDDIPF